MPFLERLPTCVETIGVTFDRSRFQSIYPWTSHYLQRPGGRLHYLDEGSGDPVLCVHGNPTWSFYWRHLVSSLSGQHRVVVPDHIGMGLSDKPLDSDYRYTLESRVADLEALIQHLNIQGRVTLVAHDWGGMIGLALAMRNPGLVKRFVLLNTAGFFLPDGRSLPWQLALIRYLPMAGLVRGLNAFSRGALLTCTFRPGGLTALEKDAYLAPYDSWDHRISVHRFVQDIPLKPGDPSFDLVKQVSDQLGSLASQPVLIYWGMKDFVFNDGFLAEWRRRLPGAEYHVFPDAGHYVMEDARETIVAGIPDFIRRHPIADEPAGARL